MPPYYWIQLYKVPTDLTIKSIVQGTLDGLANAGCDYQFSYITKIEDDSLPEENQRPIRTNVEINISEAIDYAAKDLEAWRTTEKAKKWLPGITIIFEFDFQFDKEVIKEMNLRKVKEARQVKLDFWIEKDKFFEEKIVINLDTWEEYVLMYGQEKTHNHNKRQILKIVESVCNQINPHYGWLDSEGNSCDSSYESIDTNNWKVRSEFVIVGTQLIDKVSKHNLKEAANLICTLENGCMILQS